MVENRSEGSDRQGEREKHAPSGGGGRGVPQEASFQVFLAGLYSQTMVALGEFESPVSGQLEKNLPGASYLIDTIAMLQKKTEGNLDTEESQYLRNLLHDLRMRYVNATKKEEEENTPKAETQHETQPDGSSAKASD
jgi:hypothetical protein